MQFIRNRDLSSLQGCVFLGYARPASYSGTKTVACAQSLEGSVYIPCETETSPIRGTWKNLRQ